MRGYQHPSERSLGVGRVTPSRFFSQGQRCYGDLFKGGDSASTTSAATNAASDNADIVQGGAVTKSGDFSDVQSGGVRNEDTGSVVALDAGSKLVTGVDVGANNSGAVNVTTSDPEVVREALRQVAQLSTGFGGTVSELTNKYVSAFTSQNQAEFDKLSELALSKQTDGASVGGKNIVVVMLALIAAVVLGIWAWRSS